MKAAILHQLGDVPNYEEFPDPVATSEDEVLIRVKAASIKQLDRARASGQHYTKFAQMPTTIGFDGVGELADGTAIYAQGITGMMAEKALVKNHQWTVLPPDIDLATAAALPNALLGAAAALLYRAKIKKGDTVLINGATGTTGKTAVQIARYYGAAHVIATGRNRETLEQLKSLGADEIVSLQDDDKTIINAVKKIQGATPIDIVIDYLWGHPIELILAALDAATAPVKIVAVGAMAGAQISLDSGLLRSANIELLGSGIGSLSPAEIGRYNAEVLPQMFDLATSGQLKIDVTTTPLREVKSAWLQAASAGKRVVLMI